MLLPQWIGEKITWIDRNFYFITVATAGLLMVSSGCVVAWPSPSVGRIRAGQTPVQDGYKDITGIGYIFFIGGIPGFLLTWLFLTYVGRRSGMLASALLYSVSWIVMALAKTLTWVYGARLIQGIAQTLALVITPVYIVEISPVEMREAAGFSMQFFFNMGLLIEYSVGPYVSYLTLILINLSLALLFFTLFVLIAHESPYFLFMTNRRFKAEQVLSHLRSHIPQYHQHLQTEFNVIQKILEEHESVNTWAQIKLFIFDKGMRRAMIITLGLSYLFVFSGLSQLLMFAQTIFEIADVSISPSISCILIGIVKIIGGFALPFLVKHVGIKKMAVHTTALAGIAMFCLGLFYYLRKQNYNLEYFYWAPLCLLLTYFFLTAIGLSFILMHVRAEIFPPQVKATGILIQEIVNITSLWLCSLLFTQLFQTIFVPLWFFSASMLASVVFMVYMLPNSNSMNLYEIQKWLNK